MTKKATVGAVAEGLCSEATLPISEAESFLQLLGKDPACTWFRTITPGKGANKSRSGRDLQGFDQAALEADNRTAAIYFINGDADQATGKEGAVTDADVHTCRAVFVEWDDKPIEWQVGAWRELGLPEPTAMVQTGGKSVHCYWRLAEPMAPAEWRVLQARLIAYAGGDKNCKNPSRLMRLPGFRYVDKATGQPTDRIAELIHQADVSYSAAELAACIREPQPLLQSPAPAQQPSTDLAPRGMQEILDAVAVLPPRSPQTYEQFRNALCGCSAALEEINHPNPDGEAIRLMAHLWEHGERQARQVLESSTTRHAASFWAIARDHGYDLSRRHTPDQLPAHQQEKLPASLQALIQLLPDGWSDKGSAQSLSAGRLAEMLPAHRFRFNELDLRSYVETSSGWQCISDADMDSAYVLLSGKGWKIGADPVVKAILYVARQTSVHPVRDYLQRIKADPSITPYDLDQVAPKLFRAVQPLHVAMVRKWLIGAVARAMKPGCQMDYCLVLKGGQGLLKSTSLKALAGGEWFTSSHARDDKDFLLNVHSCWIYELAELETITNKTQSGALKNLITTATDTFRTPYGRTSEKHHRQSVFCATVNKEEFLRDDTGNRRFWVVPIEGANKLDREAITAARDAIWKAAVLAHEAGELPMLTKEMEALSALQNEQFNEQDPWVGLVQAWMDNDPILRWKGEAGDPSTSKYDPGDQYSSAEILYSAGLRQANQFGKPDEMRLAEVLRSLGWHRTKQRRVNGKVTRLWQMSQPSQPSQPHVEQVVTPQTEMAAVVLGVASQPSQPLETKGLTAAEHCVKELPDASAPLLDDRGCDTPSKPRRTTAAQSVSVSQPLLSEVVTAAKVVTVEGAITDIEIGAAIEHHGSGGWRGGWRVTAAEQTNIGIRYRIESGSASLNVGADVIRLCA